MTGGRHKHRAMHPVGEPPGSLSCPAGAAPAAGPLRAELFAWNRETLVEAPSVTLEDIAARRGSLPNIWLNIDGTPDGATLEALGRQFGLHPLALEDVLHPTHRAKVDPYDKVLFVVVPIPSGAEPFDTEQLALFLGPDFVVTIQEHPHGDCLDGVRRRIRSADGRIRARGGGYLTFAIFDAVIDHYFPIVNALSERVDAIEEVVVDSRRYPDMYAIRNVKHELMRVRQAIWPMRDALTAMMTMESWFDQDHRLFLRNALDHVMRLIDMLDSDRSLSSDLMDLSVAIANAKLGEVTKVLTMIATVFIPITFIASIYGMNFKHMPELDWVWGYPFALGLMLATSIGFLFMFRRRGWFEAAMRFPRRPR